MAKFRSLISSGRRDTGTGLLPSRTRPPSRHGDQTVLPRLGVGRRSRGAVRGAPNRRGVIQQGRRVLQAAAAKAAKAAGNAAGGPVAGWLAEQAVKHPKEALYIAIAIQIALWLPLLFLLYLLFGHSAAVLQQQQQQQAGQANPLQVTVICNPPDPAAAQTSNCTINVTDTENESDISVVATIYPNAQYVSSSPAGTYAKTPATVTWDANTLNLPLSAPISLTFTLTVKATKKVGVPIVVTASAGGGATGNTAANTNNCHGVYTSWMSQVQTVLSRLNIGGANYGDPNCELLEQDPNGNWIINKDKELAYLETKLTKQQALGVFTCMIPNESSYNADAFNPSSTSATNGTGTPGAFGLLQMNAKGFSNSNALTEDIGDVVWDQQLANAVNWVNTIHGGLWHGNYTNSQGKVIQNYWPTSYNACLAQYGM